MDKLAGEIDDKTKEQIRINLINKLAGTGELSVREARELVDKLQEGDREEFDRVVGELKEKGAFEKTRGKYGLAPSEGVDLPETDFAQEAKDTASALKDALLDRPANIINSIAEDALKATVGSDLHANQRNEAERNEELKEQYAQKYAKLIQMCATPEQAKEALEGPRGSVNQRIKELRESEKEQQEGEDKDSDKKSEPGKSSQNKMLSRYRAHDPEKEQKDKPPKGDKLDVSKPPEAQTESQKILSDIFETLDPKTSDKQDFAQAGGRDRYDGPVNDAGQRVDAGIYEEGATVVTQDGTEWKNEGGEWVRTGNNYGHYTPNGLRDAEPSGFDEDDLDSSESRHGSKSGLSGFTSSCGERLNNHAKESYGLMSCLKEIEDATTSGDEEERESQGLVNAAGGDAQAASAKSAAATAAGDRENSWGKAIADGVQQGIEKGMTSAAETFGARGADKVATHIFKGSGTKDNGSSGETTESAQKGAANSPTSKQGGGGGGGGSGGAQKFRHLPHRQEVDRKWPREHHLTVVKQPRPRHRLFFVQDAAQCSHSNRDSKFQQVTHRESALFAALYSPASPTNTKNLLHPRFHRPLPHPPQTHLHRRKATSARSAEAMTPSFCIVTPCTATFTIAMDAVTRCTIFEGTSEANSDEDQRSAICAPHVERILCHLRRCGAGAQSHDSC